MNPTAWTAVGAIGAVAAALAAIVYVELTRRLWVETAKQREAQLVLMLMRDYDNLRNSIQFIQDWYLECAMNGNIDPVKRFKEEKQIDHSTPDADLLDDHRFRVSRFFVMTRKLVRGGYLDEKLVRDNLGGQAIEDVFLKRVDPLDEAKAGPNYGKTDRVFYTDLLRRYPRPVKK